MNQYIIPIDELLPERYEELDRMIRSGTEVLIEHRNGHRNPLIFSEPDPSIKNPRWVIIGLHAGMIDMADDFCAELPSEEWDGAFD